MDGSQGRSACGGEEKISSPFWDSNPGRPVHSLVAILIEPPRCTDDNRPNVSICDVNNCYAQHVVTIKLSLQRVKRIVICHCPAFTCRKSFNILGLQHLTQKVASLVPIMQGTQMLKCVRLVLNVPQEELHARPVDKSERALKRKFTDPSASL